MKSCYIIIILSILSIVAKAENIDYATIERNVNRQLFSSGKIEFEKKDLDTITMLYKSAKDKEEIAKIKYLEAIALFYALVPDYNKSERLVDESLKVLKKDIEASYNARLKLLKGMLSRRYKYEYGESYKFLSEALDSFKELEDTLYIAKTYSQLGVLWIELADYKNAIECNAKAEKLYGTTEYKQNMSYMRCNTYTIYAYQGKYDKSIKLMEQEMRRNKHNSDTAYLFILKHNIGRNYFLKGELDSAYVYFNMAHDIITECSHPNPDYKALIYGSIGVLYQQRGQLKPALQNLKTSVYYSQLSQMKEKACEAYHNLYTVYNSIGDYKNACLMIDKYEQLEDSIDKKKSIQDVNRMKYQMELNARQQQAKIDKQKDEIKQTLMLAILCVLILVLIIFAFVLFFINHRRKLQKMRNAKLTEQLEKEEMKRAIQKLEHEKDIEEKNREIATAQLLVTEKNSLLSQLIESLMPYKKSGEISAPMWSVINNFVQGNMRKEEEWSKFKVHFEKVHPEFFVKLKEFCPELTENELHLCSYIKIGGRNKEIAEMLSISSASVITSRYRIKKKLQLKDQSLDDYLRRL
ncbi:MAG: LuxR C-terminal-related transcriptional regulator [Muribaculaceae bacterium]|nr:LuxR C-terminal-related transcriptional regulator [Muribaculaceae bacterium]